MDGVDGPPEIEAILAVPAGDPDISQGEGSQARPLRIECRQVARRRGPPGAGREARLMFHTASAAVISSPGQHLVSDELSQDDSLLDSGPVPTGKCRAQHSIEAFRLSRIEADENTMRRHCRGRLGSSALR